MFTPDEITIAKASTLLSASTKEKIVKISDVVCPDRSFGRLSRCGQSVVTQYLSNSVRPSTSRSNLLVFIILKKFLKF